MCNLVGPAPLSGAGVAAVWANPLGKPMRDAEVPLPAAERPFAHPLYWAAFVLVGDPR